MVKGKHIQQKYYKERLDFLKKVNKELIKDPRSTYFRKRHQSGRNLDLRTIKFKLNHEYYRSGSQCLRDYRTMFQNFYQRISKDHPIYKHIMDLEETLKKKLERYPHLKVLKEGRHNTYSNPAQHPHKYLAKGTSWKLKGHSSDDESDEESLNKIELGNFRNHMSIDSGFQTKSDSSAHADGSCSEDVLTF